MIPRKIVVPLSIVLVAACGDGDGDASSGSSSDGAVSGFTSVTDGSDAGSAGSGAVETLGDGDLQGILTFTHYAANADGSGGEVGLAGAWRTAELGIDGLDDFHAIQRFGIWYPDPPTGTDEIEHNDKPPGFDWGEATDWLLAGTAMKLRTDETEALACLLVLAGEYPVYEASTSELHPEGCAPEPAWWQPATVYDVVLYGGDLFADNVLLEQVHTPAELTVTAPDPTHVLAAHAIDEDLDVAWEAATDPGGRIVMRLVDDDGRMITVHAEDDGAFTVAAADLADLAAGPLELVVARERIDDVPFTEGWLRVVSRFEARISLELY